MRRPGPLQSRYCATTRSDRRGHFRFWRHFSDIETATRCAHRGKADIRPQGSGLPFFDLKATSAMISENALDGDCHPYLSAIEPVRCRLVSLGADMQRRDFITLIGGAAAAWPLSAHAQQTDGVRKIAVLMPFGTEDPEGQARLQLFLQSLRKAGWVEGKNLHTEVRWAGDNAQRFHQHANELVSSTPDVILASSSASVAVLQQVTRKIPIVFANVADPVGAGFVKSLARPGGNTTGFTAFEYSISGKWLELLNELTPGLKRVAVVRDPLLAAGIGQFAAIQAMASASSTSLELSAIDPADVSEIERALAEFAHEPNGGVIVTGGQLTAAHRESIISSTNRHRLPAVYAFRYFAPDGGLAAYGPDTIDVFRRAAAYVDRILKGEKPADLPVQAPTKYELVINLRTAKAIGLNLSPALLARADEVIE